MEVNDISNIESLDNSDITLDLTVDCDNENTTLEFEVSNVATYIASFLLRKAKFCTVDACTECKQLYTLPVVPDLDKYTFVSNKSSKETGCLVYPSIVFLEFVESRDSYSTLIIYFIRMLS